MRADFRRRYAGEGLRGQLQHGHFAAGFSRRGGDFQSDEASADNGQAGARRQPLPQRQRVVDVAEIEDTRMRWVGEWNRSGTRPRVSSRAS